jgi:hypothetical protein
MKHLKSASKANDAARLSTRLGAAKAVVPAAPLAKAPPPKAAPAPAPTDLDGDELDGAAAAPRLDRPMRAAGGAVKAGGEHKGPKGKGAMNVNVIIAPSHGDGAGKAPPAGPAGAGVPMPPPHPVAKPPMGPPGPMAGPAGGPPMGPPPPGMMNTGGRVTRATGGRVAAGGGEGRLEKAKGQFGKFKASDKDGDDDC